MYVEDMTMRQTRSNYNKPNKPGNKLEKLYYTVIAILVIILIGILIFIFTNRDGGSEINEDNLNPETSEVADNGDPVGEEPAEESTENESEEDPVDEAVDTDADQSDESEESTDEPVEEDELVEEESEEVDETEESDTDTEVTTDAPLDTNYTIDYTNGSNDRIAIANAVGAVTGLDPNSLITKWVGNDGPGRVFTIVTNSSGTEPYRLTLQYGDGQWHVTTVEELSEVPAEYR